jgi:hypothetical protein
MSESLKALVPTPPNGAVTHTTTGAATAELDTSAGGFWRFHARTQEAFLLLGPAGGIAVPTAANGIPIPAGAYLDLNVPVGWKFRVFAAAAGELVWYQMPI